MKTSDYNRVERVLLYTLFAALVAVMAAQLVFGFQDWLGWLGVLVVAPQIVISLRVRRRLRRGKAVQAAGVA